MIPASHTDRNPVIISRVKPLVGGSRKRSGPNLTARIATTNISVAIEKRGTVTSTLIMSKGR